MRGSCSRIALRSTRGRIGRTSSSRSLRFLSSDTISNNSVPTVPRHPQHRFLSSNAALATSFDEPHFEQPITRHNYEASVAVMEPARPPITNRPNGSSPSNATEDQPHAHDPTPIAIDSLSKETTTTSSDGQRRSASPGRGKGLLRKIHDKINGANETSVKSSLAAVDLLMQLIDEKLKGGTRAVLKPKTVNLVLLSGQKHRSREFVRRLDEILKGLEAVSRMDADHPPMDVTTYNTMAELWGKSGIPNSPPKVERIMKRMEKAGLTPNTETYRIYLKALARSRQKDAAKKCEEILNIMHEKGLERSTSCFNACLDAWAKSGRRDAAHHAENLLVSMQQQGVKPDYISFTTIIDCLAKSKDADAAQKAEEVLHLMRELDESGMPGVRPTAITFNAVINAYSKSSMRVDAAEKADKLLQEMKMRTNAGARNVAPDRISYTSCINVYSKVKMNSAAKRAIELLREMTELCREGNHAVSPDLYTYNAVLRALGNQDEGYHADDAESVLKEMEALHEQQGNRKSRPDILSYNSVIRSCILHKKRSAKEKQKALKIAIDTLAKIRSGKFGVKADSFTFSYFFNVCGKLASTKQSEQLLKASFQWCCECGVLNTRALSSLKQSASPQFVQKLLVTNKRISDVKLVDLPRQWSRKVKDMRDRA